MKAVVVKKSSDKIFEIGDIPIPKINDDEILIKTKTIALNPTDYKHAEIPELEGNLVGTDASGIVAEVGKNVKGFAKGDYVASWDHGSIDKVRGRFAEYIVGKPEATIKVSKDNFQVESLNEGKAPSNALKTFEHLATVPLAFGTVILSFAYELKLNQDKNVNKDNYLLIWGGSSATGVIAIQIAKLIYGFKVITTSSPKNTEFLTSLGADKVFNHYDDDVADQIRNFAEGKITYAFDTIGEHGSWQKTYDATIGSDTIAIDNIVLLSTKDLNYDSSRGIRFHRTVSYNALGDDFLDLTSNPELVKVYSDFWYHVLPQYVDKFQTANLIVYKGWQHVNDGINLLLQGKVSAEKVVIRVD